MSRELPIPPDCRASSQAAEVLRAWVNPNNGLSVMIIPAFRDSGAWGVALVDIARHAARAFADRDGVTEKEALSAIKQFFDAEWHRPTDLGKTSDYSK
jgi:hypothetical protein